MVLAGMLCGSGVVAIAWRLVPAQPDAADVVARLSRSHPKVVADDAGRPDDVHEKLGLFAMRHLPPLVWASTPVKELALLRKSIARFYGEKVLFVLVPIIGVPIVAAIISMATPLHWAIPLLATVLVAGGMWFLPNLYVIEDAKEAREDFNRALGAYIDLVAMERVSGAGPRQAMETAAGMGDTWVFGRIGEELARSRWSGQAPWDALHVLSEDIGLPELDDLADIMRLSGEGGAQRLRITVDDDGAGLDPEQRAEALRRGRRLDETRPGSGLGLSIVTELAELYGGRLSLDTSPAGGLRAVLDLPGI